MMETKTSLGRSRRASRIQQQNTNNLEESFYDLSDPDNYILEAYSPIREIGSGSFSVVYQCRSNFHQKDVAVKVVCKQRLKKQALNMIIQEADFLRRLKHPSVIKLIEQRETYSKHYIVMELFRGVQLNKFVENVILTPDEIVQIVKKLCEGIAYIHSQGVIHRDLKPENVLLEENENHQYEVKIIDFGLSFKKNDFILIANQNCGTLIYMAPEMVFSQSYNQKVDIWSIGIIQYTLFSQGKHPIWQEGDTRLGFCQRLQEADFSLTPFPKSMGRLAQSFFNKTVTRLAENRMSAYQLLQHPWITGKETECEPRTMIDVIQEVEKIKKIEQLLKLMYFLQYLKLKSKKVEPTLRTASQPKITFKKHLKLNFESTNEEYSFAEDYIQEEDQNNQVGSTLDSLGSNGVKLRSRLLRKSLLDTGENSTKNLRQTQTNIYPSESPKSIYPQTLEFFQRRFKTNNIDYDLYLSRPSVVNVNTTKFATMVLDEEAKLISLSHRSKISQGQSQQMKMGGASAKLRQGSISPSKLKKEVISFPQLPNKFAKIISPAKYRR